MLMDKSRGEKFTVFYYNVWIYWPIENFNQLPYCTKVKRWSKYILHVEIVIFIRLSFLKIKIIKMINQIFHCRKDES